ncbi:MAG: beta-phosphoglucomutase family hydrolase [Microthrixaceae bacterium]
MDWSRYDAVLFDLDGVITPTADVHRRAWAEMFDAFLETLDGQEPFTDDDYLSYVDGKPRLDGVRSFLQSRGIDLAEGDPNDAPFSPTVHGLGTAKNDRFNTVLARDGVQPYPGSLALLDELEPAACELAIVSSSRNARGVLDAAGLANRFEVVVDGNVGVTEHLAGKPAPDFFLHAASLVGVKPGQAVVVEDAVSGVRAGAAGGFGLVVGVDRGAGAAALAKGGADVVVSDLIELTGAAAS